jgi:hypothetical protein
MAWWAGWWMRGFIGSATIPAMKRWLIFLLVFVLPLQMSWASAHLWENTAMDTAVVSVGGEHSHNHRHASHADQGESASTTAGHAAADPLTASEHASAHAHDGLHYGVVLEGSPLVIPQVNITHTARLLPLCLHHPLARIDRPQWFPA